MESLALTYVQAMLDVQPEGPYCIHSPLLSPPPHQNQKKVKFERVNILLGIHLEQQ